MTKKCQTIIVADGNETNLIITKSLLGDSYVVLAVPSEKTLFLLLENIKPDLILLGSNLSMMNGCVTIDTLRRFKKTTDVPIVLLSGNINPESDEEGLCMGSDDCLTKPFSQELLSAWIEKHLPGKGL